MNSSAPWEGALRGTAGAACEIMQVSKSMAKSSEL